MEYLDGMGSKFSSKLGLNISMVYRNGSKNFGTKEESLEKLLGAFDESEEKTPLFFH